MKQKIKKLVFTTAWLLSWLFTQIGKLLYVFGKKIEYFRDWGSEPSPEWFNHEFDLLFFTKWRKPYFFERGIYASEIVRKKKVLDLCCGDGSVAALFIAPLAEKVV